MKVYEFGNLSNPVILLLPGTCCHWKCNFGHVIDGLSLECASGYGGKVGCIRLDDFKCFYSERKEDE